MTASAAGITTQRQNRWERCWCQVFGVEPRWDEATTSPSLLGRLVQWALFFAATYGLTLALVLNLLGLVAYDDIAILAAAVVAVFRANRFPAMARVGVTVIIAAFGVASLHSSVGMGTTAQLARQVTMPCLLVMIGLGMSRADWAAIKRMSVWVALANAAYMILELIGVRLINPAVLVGFGGTPRDWGRPLPDYYYYWAESGLWKALGLDGVHERLGGLVLNPPMAGYVTAVGMLIVLYSRSEHPILKLLLVAVLGGLTVLTVSRGAMVVALIGAGLPLAVRLFGRLATALGVAVAGVAGLVVFGGDGNSSIHSTGFSGGFWAAVDFPWGMGFGTAGNIAPSGPEIVARESLLAIAFAAGGLLVVAGVGFALLVLWRHIESRTHGWQAALGIGIIAASAFSETAGGLVATIPAWIILGAALQATPEDILSEVPQR